VGEYSKDETETLEEALKEGGGNVFVTVTA
jgi:hypothetical protein